MKRLKGNGADVVHPGMPHSAESVETSNQGMKTHGVRLGIKGRGTSGTEPTLPLI